MARLPVVSGDTSIWGDVLNEYLSVAHNADGTQKTLAVGSGGTGTGTAFTAGSIPFAGTGGVYTQNNANLFWDNTNLRLGIGTTAPTRLLTVDAASMPFMSFNTGGSERWVIGRNTSAPAGFGFYDAQSASWRMVLEESTGNIGLGTVGPGQKLTVRSNDNTAATNIAAFYALNDTVAVGIGFQDVRQVVATQPLSVNAGTTGQLKLADVSTGGISMVLGGGLVSIGTTMVTGAGAGEIVVPNSRALRSVNAAGTSTVAMISLTGAANAITLNPSTNQDLLWGTPLVALGGGAAPTLGTIGGTGPTTAAQNTWMRVLDSGGAAFWVPAWK